MKFRRRLLMAARVGLMALLAVSASGLLLAAVPNPTVLGPIANVAPPGDPSHNYTFFSAIANLPSYGYVEQEFFIQGMANRYNTPPMMTATVIDGNHPYRTRIVVRRPVKPQRFNGIVLMEWLNVTGGYDLDAAWVVSAEHILRRGYAWVGISAQAVGVHWPGTGLKAWGPARYGTLDVTAGGSVVNDELCYDIFSQAGQAVRHPLGIDPMGGLPVKWILAVGISQSASRLVTYYNSIQPLAGMFDGFAYEAGFMPNESSLLRTDLSAKAFKVVSETDVMGVQASMRQPDSDVFRRWEIAGSAHFGAFALQEFNKLQSRDGIWQPATDCDRPPLTRIPGHYVANASYDALSAWITAGVAPSHAPDITVSSAGPPAVVVRDAFENALGGVRLSQHAVPTATNSAVNSGANPFAFCFLYGAYIPFSETTLNALYKNHGAYVSAVTQATHDALRKGFIVQEDAAATIREAVHSRIGK